MLTKNTTHEGKPRGFLTLNQFLRMLQKSISTMVRMGRTDGEDSDEELEASAMVADDVKEGHFAVLAVKGEKRRFVVDLEFLSDPRFLKLLEEAEKEYGYEQKGALEIPCQPEELQRILEVKMEKKMTSVRQWIRVYLSDIATLLW